MNLIQKAFNSIPDWLKVRIFELNNDEKWFLETYKKAKKTVNDCIYKPWIGQDISDCECIKKEMEYILNLRKDNIRFQKYFSEDIQYINHLIKLLYKYR